MLGKKIKKLQTILKEQGLWPTIKEVIAFIKRRYSIYKDDKIDRQYGTNTGGFNENILKYSSPQIQKI